MRLKDKVAIVTGSSRGLGKAVAIDFAKEGASVVVAARTEQEEKLPGTIYATAEEIRALGGKALPMKCNVAEEESVEEMARKTLDEFGKIDILVNNAATGWYLPVSETPTRRFDIVCAVNFRGPFLCMKAVLPKMMEQKSGSIINISSPGAEELYSQVVREGRRRPTGFLYGATKAALERMTKAVAIEASEYNIVVNVLKPSALTFSEGGLLVNPGADPSTWRSPNLFFTPAVLFLATQTSQGLTGGVFKDEELCYQYHLA